MIFVLDWIQFLKQKDASGAAPAASVGLWGAHTYGEALSRLASLHQRQLFHLNLHDSCEHRTGSIMGARPEI